MKITRRQLRKLAITQVDSALKELVEFHGSGFQPELALDTATPEMELHLKNIQNAQANGNLEDEKSAILEFLESLSDIMYEEAREGEELSYRRGLHPSDDTEWMLADAIELGEYVQKALSGGNDDLGWIQAVSRYVRKSNPLVKGRPASARDYQF